MLLKNKANGIFNVCNLHCHHHHQHKEQEKKPNERNTWWTNGTFFHSPQILLPIFNYFPSFFLLFTTMSNFLFHFHVCIKHITVYHTLTSISNAYFHICWLQTQINMTLLGEWTFSCVQSVFTLIAPLLISLWKLPCWKVKLDFSLLSQTNILTRRLAVMKYLLN